MNDSSSHRRGNSRRRVPSYCLHKPTGQAYCRIDGQQVYLGKYGSQKSREEYERRVAAWLEDGGFSETCCVKRREIVNSWLSIAELAVLYLRHCREFFIGPSGEISRSIELCETAVRELDNYCGDWQVSDFGPRALKNMRANMFTRECLKPGSTDSDGNRLTWSRQHINKVVDAVRRVFCWGASEELVSAEQYHALMTVATLQRGRHGVRESAEILPVDDAIIEQTIPHLPPIVADMVRLQRLTGMRPGEVCCLSPDQIDCTNDIWIYLPIRHKTSYRGKVRAIAIGPRAQSLLTPYLDRDPADYCFSPEESEKLWLLDKRRRRKTPVQPSQQALAEQRANLPRKKRPGKLYTTGSYRQAIHRACKRKKIEPWHPNQLRHTAATEISSEFDLDTARAVLGHESVKTTTIYALPDVRRAMEVARKLG